MTNGPSQQSPAIENHILRNLPPSDWERIAPHLQAINFNHSEVLYQAEETVEVVYFPNLAILSLIAQDRAGQSVEVGIVGFEGMAGVSTALDGEKSPFRIIVQFPSTGYCMNVRAFR